MSITKELKYFANSLSLLVVEDELVLNSELVEMLSLFFNSVDFTLNGQDGIEKYREKQFDVVLTDISMPKMNGIEMSREIKLINPKSHIIVLSAHSDTKYMIDLIDIGIDQFILKPFDKNTLMFKLLKVSENIILEKKFEKHAKQKQIKRLEEIKVEDYQSFALELDKNDGISSDGLLWKNFQHEIPSLIKISESLKDNIKNIKVNGLTTKLKVNITEALNDYISILSTINKMKELTTILTKLVNFIIRLDVDMLSSKQHKKLQILEYINNDIEKLLQTIFIYKDQVDIYYLEYLIDSSITQLKHNFFTNEEDNNVE